MNLRLLAVVCFLFAVLAPGAHAADFSAIAVDARTGQVLFNDDADGQRHPASLTKMMTLYLMFEDLKSGKIKRNTEFKVSARAAAMPPSKLNLRPGSSITAEDAIFALITKSANDVAATVGENLGGSESAFAQRMSRTAHAMGMKRTNFYNASGLPHSQQVTTARDLATLGLRIMRDFPQYYPYFRTTEFEFMGRTIRTHNALVLHYPGTDGFKTGYIADSGYNLATSTKQGDKRLVGVVLGARSAFNRSRYMRQMLERNFAKAKEGQTIAALAGSSVGVIDPIAETKSAAQLNNLGLAAAAADASAQEKSTKTGPKVEQAELDPANGLRRNAADNSNDPISTYVESWNVQIGSYPEKDAAETQVQKARQKFTDLLNGKPGFTMEDEIDGDTVFTARFAGFTEQTAAKTCARIKQSGSKCQVIEPES